MNVRISINSHGRQFKQFVKVKHVFDRWLILDLNFISEKPREHIQSPIAPSIVAIITVSCLLCVAGVTTVCFCLMRERKYLIIS